MKRLNDDAEMEILKYGAEKERDLQEGLEADGEKARINLKKVVSVREI